MKPSVARIGAGLTTMALATAVSGLAQATATDRVLPDHGARLALACETCHGPAGDSRGAVPSLAGLPQHRFIARMHDFKQGDGTIMNRIAPAYSEADIKALAAYFAARSPKANDR